MNDTFIHLCQPNLFEQVVSDIDLRTEESIGQTQIPALKKHTLLQKSVNKQIRRIILYPNYGQKENKVVLSILDCVSVS